MIAPDPPGISATRPARYANPASLIHPVPDKS